jgi:hypothetical protein
MSAGPGVMLMIVITLCVLGVLLQLAGVAWVVLGAKRIEPQCRGCGYLMQGLPADQEACPECGRGLLPLDRRARLTWETRKGSASVFHPMILWLAGCLLFLFALVIADPVYKTGLSTQAFIIPIYIGGQPKAGATVTCQAPVQTFGMFGTYERHRKGEPDLSRVMVSFSKRDFGQEVKVARLYVMDLQEVRGVSGVAIGKPQESAGGLVRAMFDDAGISADPGEEASVVELFQEVRSEALNARTGQHIPLVPFNSQHPVARNTTMKTGPSMLDGVVTWGPFVVLGLWLVCGWGGMAARIKGLEVGLGGEESRVAQPVSPVEAVQR